MGLQGMNYESRVVPEKRREIKNTADSSGNFFKSIFLEEIKHVSVGIGFVLRRAYPIVVLLASRSKWRLMDVPQ